MTRSAKIPLMWKAVVGAAPAACPHCRHVRRLVAVQRCDGKNARYGPKTTVYLACAKCVEGIHGAAVAALEADDE